MTRPPERRTVHRSASSVTKRSATGTLFLHVTIWPARFCPAPLVVDGPRPAGRGIGPRPPSPDAGDTPPPSPDAGDTPPPSPDAGDTPPPSPDARCAPPRPPSPDARWAPPWLPSPEACRAPRPPSPEAAGCWAEQCETPGGPAAPAAGPRTRAARDSETAPKRLKSYRVSFRSLEERRACVTGATTMLSRCLTWIGAATPPPSSRDSQEFPDAILLPASW